MTTYYLIRHGTTAWVDQQKLHGITDIPLNENGLQQAQLAAEAMQGTHAAHLFSSPLSRAMQTAQAIGEKVHLTPNPEPGFMEMNFGWMEGKVIEDDLHTTKPKIVYMYEHHLVTFVRFLSGDSKRKFQKRVIQTWQRILGETRGEDSIIVAHSGVLNVILEECFGPPQSSILPYYSTHPCSITTIEVDEALQPHLVKLDDYTHLQEWYPVHD
ncbi:MAG: 2,3-bisphosphoglycerate-dependent phosphoglycerate mutase [Chloroflexota bacterium]|nr:2,3-bisphosphoglycerate-dependent phosphoglycerate mutase [Chloroflexota bacterium]